MYDFIEKDSEYSVPSVKALFKYLFVAFCPVYGTVTVVGYKCKIIERRTEMNKEELYIWANRGFGMFSYTTAYRPAVERLIGEGMANFGFKSDGGEVFKAMFQNITCSKFA